MNIFALWGEIEINRQKAEQDIEAVEKQAERSGKQMESSFNKVTKAIGAAVKNINDFGKKATKLGADLSKTLTAPVVGVTAALGALAVKSADTARRIEDLSHKMGISTDAFQEMSYWATQNGISQAELERAVGRLNQRMGLAANGNEGYAKALERLGVSMDDVRRGAVSTEQAMAITISTLSQMTNEQEKSAAAADLFGTMLARNLMPALSEGALSIEEAAKKAHELGLVLEADAISKASEFGDKLDDLKARLSAATTEIGLSLAPTFEALVRLVDNKVVPAIRTFGDWLTGLIEGFRNLHPGLQSVILSLTGFAVAIGPALSIVGRLTSGIGTLISTLGALVPLLGSVSLPLVAVVAGVGALGLALATTNRDMSKFYDQALSVAEANRRQAGTLENLVREYKELSGKPDKSEEEHRRLEQVMQDIIEIQPQLAKGYDSIDEAIQRNIGTLETYIETLKMQSETQLVQAQLEFLRRRNSLEEERNRLLKKREQLEAQIGPAHTRAIDMAREIAELEQIFLGWRQAAEEGADELAKSLEEQMRVIIQAVQPDWDLTSGLWGKWVYELQKMVEDATKNTGNVVKELEMIETAIAKIDEEFAKGEAIGRALEDLHKPYVERVKKQTEVVIAGAQEQNEEREEFERYWNDMLFDLQADRLEKLEREYKEAIALAEKYGADRSAVDEYYSIMRAQILQEEQDEINKEIQKAIQRRELFEAEYSKKIFEQSADRIDILQREKQEQIKLAMDAGANWLLVDTYYNNLIAEERRKIAEEVAKAAEEEVKKEEEALRKKQEAREAFEEEWNRKLFEQTADRIDILQREKQEQIKIAIEAGHDWTKIDTYYNNLIAEERRRRAEELARIADEEAKIEAEKEAQKQALRERLEADWHRKLFELSADRIDILEREKQENIAIAMEAGADWLIVDEYYNRLIAEERKRRADEVLKIAEEEAKKEAELQERKRKEREDYEAYWNRMAFNSVAERIDILQREYQQELKIAAEKGADTAAIARYYESEITKERQRQAEERAKIAEQEAAKEKKAREERLAFEREWTNKLFELTATPEMRLERLAVEAKEMEKLAIDMEASAEAILAIQEYYAAKQQELIDQIAEGQKSWWDKKMDELDSPLDRLKSAVWDAGKTLFEFGKAISSGNWLDAFLAILMETESFALAMEILGKVLQPVISLFDAVLLPIVKFIGGLWNAIMRGLSSISIFGWKPFGGLEKHIIDFDGDEDGGGKSDKGRGGGRQVSEITGPTRDLLVDLLSPLANFGQIVAPIQDIRNILYERLPNFDAFGMDFAGAGAIGGDIVFESGAIVISSSGTSATELSRDMLDAIEREMARRVNFGIRGRGGR